ncbi:dihydrofolate reductase [Entomophthora muscae]|uniref:Dihydrofolate reductase n=1 Tax=Entomophthora muscae TaxID=34485 RepID=A0ACC2SUN7_9FUNG|nr:dihydrofolate reductase [Entomophthora muscae]
MKHENRRSQTSVVTSLTDALELSAEITAKSGGSVFVIGGSYLYSESVVHPNCNKFFITELFDHPPFMADIFFPEYRSILAAKENSWDNGANLTIPVVDWLNTLPVSPRRPPIVSSKDVKADSEGNHFITENGISYRFMVYSRNI